MIGSAPPPTRSRRSSGGAPSPTGLTPTRRLSRRASRSAFGMMCQEALTRVTRGSVIRVARSCPRFMSPTSCGPTMARIMIRGTAATKLASASRQTLTPDQWFYQTNWPSGTNIYWISIEADMSNGTAYQWGWKTRPHTNSAPDAAVMFDPTVPWYQPLIFPTTNDLWDLAFELHYTSASVSSKYQQLPDLSTTGMDVNATSNSPTYLFLLADDFPCYSTGPITNITIWGSWEYDYPPNE